jgi:hypothetical protein
MIIAIPTRGRISTQTTLAGIPRELHKSVQLFCPYNERGALQQKHPSVTVRAQPDTITTISKKRAWMLQTLHEEGVDKCLMLDDDLFFYVRREDRPDRLRDATAEDVIEWFGKLEEKLSPDVPHAGFGPRQGNHTFPAGWHTGRMMLALGYHLPTVLAHAQLGRIRTREDMDVCLQLLREGFPNAVCHEFAVGQKSYGAAGGCSDERTVATSDADAHLLAELHPGLVRVVEKDYKGTPRMEVVCQWQRALREGAQRRTVRTPT